MYQSPHQQGSHQMPHMSNRETHTTYKAAHEEGRHLPLGLSCGWMQNALKFVATELNYPEFKGIPTERINTHSLRAGGQTLLPLPGTPTEESKIMGRLRIETFKEYISNQLSNFLAGTSKSTKTVFNFIKVEGGAFHDITKEVVNIPYTAPASAA